MTLNRASMVLPLLGAFATAFVAWHTAFLAMPPRAQDCLWLAALVLPFAFAFHMTLGGLKAGNLPRLIASGVFSVLLSVPAAICFTNDGRGDSSQLILVFAPLYLWIVVALMTLVGIALDALRNSRHKTYAS